MSGFLFGSAIFPHKCHFTIKIAFFLKQNELTALTINRYYMKCIIFIFAGLAGILRGFTVAGADLGVIIHAETIKRLYPISQCVLKSYIHIIIYVIIPRRY